MKFEILNEKPALADRGEKIGARFTLEHAPFAGQSFTVIFHICANPVCPCGVVGFECRSEGAPKGALRFDLDIFERQLNTQVESAPEGVALGRAFLAEAQDAQWVWLGETFLAAKHRQMETMDLDTLAVDLPADVQAGDGTMVGYREIFPWAESFKFTRDGEEWFVDDLHCLQAGCDCTETGLGFFRLPPRNSRSSGRESAPSSGAKNQPAEPLRCVTFLFHDYVSGKTNVKEAHSGSPTAVQLMQALRAAHPKLAETLRHRHGQLQQLGRRLMPKPRRRSKRPFSYLWGDGMEEVESLLPPASAPAAPRSAPVGRNDPCPCGSGKKFKKCCGAA